MLKYEKEGFYTGFLKKKKAKSLLVVDYGTMYRLCWVLQYITHYKQRIDRLRMESDIIEKQLQWPESTRCLGAFPIALLMPQNTTRASV